MVLSDRTTQKDLDDELHEELQELVDQIGSGVDSSYLSDPFTCLEVKKWAKETNDLKLEDGDTCDEKTIEAIFRVNTKLLFKTKAFIEKIQEAIEQGDLDESFTCRDVKIWAKKMSIVQDDGTPYTEEAIDSILIADTDSLSEIDIESVKKYIEEDRDANTGEKVEKGEGSLTGSIAAIADLWGVQV